MSTLAANTSSVAEDDNASKLVYLKQGWSEDEREKYYRTYEGSQLIPYDWFLALEQASNQEQFRADKNIERFRYLPSITKSQLNPDNLPVGFTKEQDPRTGTWLGLNCAACHTGQINYQGRSARIDGAPALADFPAFSTAMAESLRATLKNNAKFDRFAKHVLNESANKQQIQIQSLHRDVQRFTEDFESYLERNKAPHPYGYGRLDALGISLNEVTGTAMQIPSNISPPEAPVSYPALWLTPELEWVQWNGSVTNPLTRNVGQALSVFGKATLSGPIFDHFKSTVYVRNLYELEKQIGQLEVPVWPEEILGTIDRTQAVRGEALFQVNCASCHANKPPYPMTSPNRFGKSLIKVERTKLADVGTDPIAAERFAKRVSKTGNLAPYFTGPDGRQLSEVPTPTLFGFIATLVSERQLDELRLLNEEKIMYRGYRERVSPGDLLAYKAGPLAGVWATAPYLHNGSVPNLNQLLLPSEKRDKTFHVGSQEFDPVNVGFKTEASAGSMEFQTTLPGNSNAGHEYGTTLNDDDRHALIEYLKTL
ncbi:MAG TPA: di-heme-cytochrome C peroxidase [Trichocoleus sp.]|jgi:mono/diheme cytochrome c family protein